MPPPMTKKYIIPLHGNFTAGDFAERANRRGYEGFCEVCDLRVGRVRVHFSKYHSTPDTRSLPSVITHIKSLDIPPKRVNTGVGFCSLPLCRDAEGNPKRIVNLKTHFVNVHLKNKVTCHICKKDVLVDSLRRHLPSHSGQVACAEEDCESKPISIEAAKAHRLRRHPLQKLNIRDLTDDEIIELLQAKAEAQGLQTKNKSKGNAITVKNLKEEMRKYSNRMLEKDPDLMNKIDTLYNKFLEFFSVPDDDDIKVVKNSSFVTLWKKSWQTPLLVFEKIHKTTGKTQLRASTFHPDPQVAKLNQPRSTSFRLTGYCFGHMASGANFREEDDFVPSHFFTNICGMRRYYNWLVRPYLEKQLRQMANGNDEPLYAVHFPVMRRNIHTKLDGVHVGDAFGTVLLTEDARGPYIKAWEMDNSDEWQNINDCIVDPFPLLSNNNIPFRKNKDDFSPVGFKLIFPSRPMSTSTLTSSCTGRSITSSSASTKPATPTPTTLPVADVDDSYPLIPVGEDEDDSMYANNPLMEFPLFPDSDSEDYMEEVKNKQQRKVSSSTYSARTPAMESESPSSSLDEESDISTTKSMEWVKYPKKSAPIALKKRVRPLTPISDDDDDTSPFSAAPPTKKYALPIASVSDDDDDFKPTKQYLAYKNSRKNSSSTSSSTNSQSTPISSLCKGLSSF